MAEQNTTVDRSGQRPTLSVAIITYNEEANIRRTLESVKWADEIVVVDSGSTDRTCEIAREYGAKIFVEPWKGFAAQKNSALEKCTGDWILSLDADEEVSAELCAELEQVMKAPEGELHLDGNYAKSFAWWKGDPGPENRNPGGKVHFVLTPELYAKTSDEVFQLSAVNLPRRNHFLGRWIQYGGFFPDYKLRLFKRGMAQFENRAVHEDVRFSCQVTPAYLRGPLIHHAYPTLTSYIEHMNRYSSLGAEMVLEKKGRVGFSLVNILLRPWATFVYNYLFRLGFLDGKEGLLLHLYHAVYVSWKYAKAWELSREKSKSN
jgi:glycosyltransferase involved in cell wall biosynthesis